jgi:hypothetical protein
MTPTLDDLRQYVRSLKKGDAVWVLIFQYKQGDKGRRQTGAQLIKDVVVRVQPLLIETKKGHRFTHQGFARQEKGLRWFDRQIIPPGNVQKTIEQYQKMASAIKGHV